MKEYVTKRVILLIQLGARKNECFLTIIITVIYHLRYRKFAQVLQQRLFMDVPESVKRFVEDIVVLDKAKDIDSAHLVWKGWLGHIADMSYQSGSVGVNFRYLPLRFCDRLAVLTI